MLKISQKQMEELSLASQCDFIERLALALRARGLASNSEMVAGHVTDAISFGLTTELAVSVYVNCILRLEKQQLGTRRLQALAARDDIDVTQRVVVLTMLVERIEKESKARSMASHG